MNQCSIYCGETLIRTMGSVKWKAMEALKSKDINAKAAIKRANKAEAGLSRCSTFRES